MSRCAFGREHASAASDERDQRDEVLDLVDVQRADGIGEPPVQREVGASGRDRSVPGAERRRDDDHREHHQRRRGEVGVEREQHRH